MQSGSKNLLGGNNNSGVSVAIALFGNGLLAIRGNVSHQQQLHRVETVIANQGTEVCLLLFCHGVFTVELHYAACLQCVCEREREREREKQKGRQTCNLAFSCSFSHSILSRSFSAADLMGSGIILPNRSKCPRRSPANAHTRRTRSSERQCAYVHVCARVCTCVCVHVCVCVCVE